MQDLLKNAQVRQSEAACHMADLKARLKDLETKGKQIKDDKLSIERKLAEWKQKHEKAKKDIQKLKERAEGVIVSEHAIVRYFERVLQFDLEEIKSKILGGNSPKFVAALIQEGKLPTDTHKAVIHEGTVVTILTQDGQNH